MDWLYWKREHKSTDTSDVQISTGVKTDFLKLETLINQLENVEIIFRLFHRKIQIQQSSGQH